MAALIDLYKCNHAQLIEWVTKTYGIIQERTGSGILQAPYTSSAYTKFNTAALNPHRIRREDIARRVRLYRDDALLDMYMLIDQTYNSVKYQTELKKFVKLALGQNVTRRIIDEVASLYDQPCKRKLKSDKEQEKFRAEEKRLHLHELFQENQRLMTLCNETLIWQFTGADGQSRLRVVTPDLFDAIPHPTDDLVAAGLLVDRAVASIFEGDKRARLPHWDLWDDTYHYRINAYGRLVDDVGEPVDTENPEKHGFGRVPGALLHRREPTTKILDASHGSDIVSAHLAVNLLNLLEMRLMKVQGENQPVIQGNLAALADGQVMDGENPLKLPPETKAFILNMKTDPEHYIKAKRDVITSVAQTYGMSYEQMTNSETTRETSGHSLEVRRVKLMEIRAEAKRRALLNERLVVDLMGFDTDGWKVDHREPTLPQDPIGEVALLADMMRMGLDSPVQWLQRKDTDLHREDAIDRIQDNLNDYAMLIVMLRALNAPSGAPQAGVGQSAQANGAMSASFRKGPGMDNTNFGGPIQGPQVTLRVRSEEASQIVQSGLSAQNPVEGFTALDRPVQQAGYNGRQG